MNLLEMANQINREVYVQFNKIKVLCIIVDAKNAYGNTRVLVRPVRGDGEEWIDISRIKE